MAEAGGSKPPLSKGWSAVAVVLLLLVAGALMAGLGAVRALIAGDPIDVGTALFIGFVYAGGLLVCVGIHVVYDRYGDSEPEGELPEPKEGISRWTQ
jgi:hypothetical protein